MECDVKMFRSDETTAATTVWKCNVLSGRDRVSERA